MNGVLILTGQTASGKTQAAVALAERFDAEIVGADSRQVYRGMPIGTAAPSDDERRRVPHHLVGFLDPYERYSAARYVADALAAVDGIAARGRRAIVAGGTGFYVRALAGDVALEGERSEPLRERLARESLLHPPEVLHAWLAALEPARAALHEPQDRYRIVRALEAALARRASEPPRARNANDNLRARGVAVRKVMLTVPGEVLDARIRARVDAMLGAGFVGEAERVGARAVAADAVGYREALAFSAGWMTERELRERLFRRTRQYAKRQATWFRSEPALQPIDGLDAVISAAMVARELPGWA